MSRPPPPSINDFTFFETIRVRSADVDMQGIVFNPNYLVYADNAMTEYMRTIGFPYPDALIPFGADIFAVASSVAFRDSARFDDVLKAGARVDRIGRTSFRFHFGFFRDGALLVEARTTYVCATPGETRTTVPAPAPFIEAVTAFEASPPERA